MVGDGGLVVFSVVFSYALYFSMFDSTPFAPQTQKHDQQPFLFSQRPQPFGLLPTAGAWVSQSASEEVEVVPDS